MIWEYADEAPPAGGRWERHGKRWRRPLLDWEIQLALRVLDAPADVVRLRNSLPLAAIPNVAKLLGAILDPPREMARSLEHRLQNHGGIRRTAEAVREYRANILRRKELLDRVALARLSR